AGHDYSLSPGERPRTRNEPSFSLTRPLWRPTCRPVSGLARYPHRLPADRSTVALDAACRAYRCGGSTGCPRARRPRVPVSRLTATLEGVAGTDLALGL